jgi:hypothetical protein
VVRAKDDANESPPKPSSFPPPPKRTNGGKDEPDRTDGTGEEKPFSAAPVVLDPLADQK